MFTLDKKRCLLLSLLALIILIPKLVEAQCQTINPNNPNIIANITGGLVSSQQINNFISTTGECIRDQRAAFIPYKIDGFDSLKKEFYTNAKPEYRIPYSGESATQAIFIGTTNQAIYSVGNLVINGPTSELRRPVVVFVDNDISINHNIVANSNPVVANQSGLVLVAKGNIKIDQSVTRIDAILISQGIIYTASQNGSNCTPNSVAAQQLVINGSLISINPNLNTQAIIFCRTLPVNFQTPAELIVQQHKYIVILRDIFSQNLRVFQEIY